MCLEKEENREPWSVEFNLFPLRLLREGRDLIFVWGSRVGGHSTLFKQ